MSIPAPIRSSEWVVPKEDPFAEARNKANLSMVKDLAGMAGDSGLVIVAAITLAEIIIKYRKAHPSPTAQQKFDKLLEQTHKNAKNVKSATKGIKKLEAQAGEIEGHIKQLEQEIEFSKNDLKGYKQRHGLEEGISKKDSPEFKAKAKDPGFMKRYEKLKASENLLKKQKANLTELSHTKDALQKTIDNAKATNEAIAKKAEEVKNEAIRRAAIKAENKAEEKLNMTEMKEFKKKEVKKENAVESEQAKQQQSAEEKAAALAKDRTQEPKKPPPNNLEKAAKKAAKALTNTIKEKLTEDQKFNLKSTSYQKTSKEMDERVEKLTKNEPETKLGKEMQTSFVSNYQDRKASADAKAKAAMAKYDAANKKLEKLEKLDNPLLTDEDKVTMKEDIAKAEAEKKAAAKELGEARKEQKELSSTVQANEMQAAREDTLGEGDTLGQLFSQDEDGDEDPASIDEATDEKNSDKEHKSSKDDKDDIDKQLEGDSDTIEKAGDTVDQVTEDSDNAKVESENNKEPSLGKEESEAADLSKLEHKEPKL